MNSDNDLSDANVVEDEQRLQALFDETVTPPPADALQRMARVAAQIPEQAMPWYRRVWFARPVAFATLAVGAMALLLVVAGEQGDGELPGLPPRHSGVVTVNTSATADADDGEDAALAELLAFEVTDAAEGDDYAMDADPMVAWQGNDDVEPLGEHPIDAFDLLVGDGVEDVEMLGGILDDWLGEGS